MPRRDATRVGQPARVSHILRALAPGACTSPSPGTRPIRWHASHHRHARGLGVAPAIVTEGLGKRFGPVVALEDLDLEVAPGDVFGFLGPNGAGKTTTIRLLLDFLRPTGGRARVLGLDPRADAVEIRRRCGYLPSEMPLDPRLTGAELLTYFANLRGGVDATRRDELVERVGLDTSRSLRTLSTGNKKKVGIVQAFMHRPELLILDEPTSGLDPLVQRFFLDLVKEVAGEGACVFLSSHVLNEVEDVADRVAILRDGRLATIDTIAALTERAVRRLHLRFSEPVPAAEFEGLTGVVDVRVEGSLVEATVSGSPDALVKAAARHELLDLSAREHDLEEVFLDLYRGGPAAGED
jgi:ABC-2 type transport system ATP-binding protein